MKKSISLFRELRNPKFKQRIVSLKKGKGSYNRFNKSNNPIKKILEKE